MWVVEDSPAMAAEIRQALEPFFNVEIFQEGLFLLERLSVDAPAAIILDWELPGLSGVQICRDVRATGNHLPILIVTIHEDVSRLVEAFEAGATDFIRKPLDSSELVARLSARIRTRRRVEAEKALQEHENETLRVQQRTAHFAEMFLGIVSHDLRNPLAVITLSAEMLLRKGTLDPSALAQATRIHKNGKRASLMITQLLDLTRIRLGSGIPLDRTPCNLAHIVSSVVDDMRLNHPDAQLIVDADQSATLELDASRIERLVGNLVENALKHGIGGRVEITLRMDHGAAVMSVHNQGKPIPSSLLNQIFEPFVRSEGSRENRQGLGLGLYICRAICEAHGGSIDVHSSEEAGTTFTVHLPR